MREILLSLHILSAIVWLGAGLYDLFLLREIRRSAGTPLELALIRIHLRYGPVIAVATFLALLSGLLMSSLLGWGYFASVWLGTKQALMLGVLVLMVPFVPVIMRLQRAVNTLPDNGAITDEVRTLVMVGGRYELAMRTAAFLAVLVAVWRPQ
jgi:uncharacterized membrane protein